MNQEDIIRMAREAGMYQDLNVSWNQSIQNFAALIAAAERDACAGICDRFQMRDVGMQPAECAGAIRARGETK